MNTTTTPPRTKYAAFYGDSPLFFFGLSFSITHIDLASHFTSMTEAELAILTADMSPEIRALVTVKPIV
jgi:hypothetical protein